MILNLEKKTKKGKQMENQNTKLQNRKKQETK
jgi:hypothetical protein